MKNRLLGLLLLMCTAAPILADSDCCNPCDTCCEFVEVNCDPCACKATSQTFFSVRPQFQIGTPEHDTLWRDRQHDRVDGIGGAFQFALFGGKSTKRGHLAAFFMPDCKTQLRVKETPDDETDVIAGFFNIATNDGDFDSIISFAPQQSVFGLGLSYKQEFARQESGREWWFEISTPLTRVKNTMGFCETVKVDGGGVLETFTNSDDEEVPTNAVANMVQAFKQASWECGKIDCSCEQTKTRLADISLLVGYKYVNTDMCHAESYAGVLIPTGNAVCGGHVFEAIVGHNKHAGIMFGSSAGLEIWNNEGQDKHLWIELHAHSLYLFRKTEKRLLDVKNKPWSRYMPVYINEEQAQEAADAGDAFLHTPGVNVFCRDLCVKPGFQRAFDTAFIFTTDRGFEAEFGYNFFARPDECVQLACPWVEGPAFKATQGAGFTNSVQQIGDDFGGNNDLDIDDYADNLIKACDLDLESAAHPCVATHTFYGVFGYVWAEREYPIFLNAGGSYEFSDSNAGLDRWLLWVKTGVSF